MGYNLLLNLQFHLHFFPEARIDNSSSAASVSHQAIIWTSVWWRHQMETFSELLAFLYGEFTGHQWIPHTKASDAELWRLFDRRLNQQLSKQWGRRLFETPWRALWRHCNGWLSLIYLAFICRFHWVSCVTENNILMKHQSSISWWYLKMSTPTQWDGWFLKFYINYAIRVHWNVL